MIVGGADRVIEPSDTTGDRRLVDERAGRVCRNVEGEVPRHAGLEVTQGTEYIVGAGAVLDGTGSGAFETDRVGNLIADLGRVVTGLGDCDGRIDHLDRMAVFGHHLVVEAGHATVHAGGIDDLSVFIQITGFRGERECPRRAGHESAEITAEQRIGHGAGFQRTGAGAFDQDRVIERVPDLGRRRTALGQRNRRIDHLGGGLVDVAECNRVDRAGRITCQRDFVDQWVGVTALYLPVQVQQRTAVRQRCARSKDRTEQRVVGRAILERKAIVVDQADRVVDRIADLAQRIRGLFHVQIDAQQVGRVGVADYLAIVGRGCGNVGRILEGPGRIAHERLTQGRDIARIEDHGFLEIEAADDHVGNAERRVVDGDVVQNRHAGVCGRQPILRPASHFGPGRVFRHVGIEPGVAAVDADFLEQADIRYGTQENRDAPAGVSRKAVGWTHTPACSGTGQR